MDPATLPGKRRMRVKFGLAIFGVAFLVGLTIWLMSPLVTGQEEPWDASWWYLAVALAAAGLVAGLITCRRLWIAVLGLYFGQFTVLVMRPQKGAFETAPLWLGAALLAAFTTIAFAAGAMGWIVRRSLSRSNRSQAAPATHLN